MKNYTYEYIVKDRGFSELLITEYTAEQKDMMEFIKSMSSVIKKARCGWSGVRYEVMMHKDGNAVAEYMVLYCNGGGSRWINITGNSKGCNFSVLGENLW